MIEKLKIYNYNGIALTEEKEGANCWGHKEGESCIHLKFGHPFKYYTFNKEFREKHKKFVDIYLKAFEDLGVAASTENKTEREILLYIWREIINLCESKELVVIFNMCDLEAGPEAVAFYAIQQNSTNNWTWKELTAD